MGREDDFVSAVKNLCIFRAKIPLSFAMGLVFVGTSLLANDDRVIRARYIEAPIVIDGILDELAWALVEPATDFVQTNPVQGEPATERTEVRLLYDDDNLYVGVYCFDSEGEQGIVVTDVTRDYQSSENDHFALVLDTFDDDRNGFLFGTNPEGAKRDAQTVGDGTHINFDWDGIWHVKTQITEQGWQVEMAIPFKTLRFREGDDQIWGVNFVRHIRRKNEVAHWSLVTRPYRMNRVSLAGTLEGLGGIRQGRNFYLKPYISTPITRREGDDVDFMPEVGMDAKYGVTPGLTLDLTLNTDFAQVEADVQQINLTRFSLFFPEKRDFFLENSGIFEFAHTGRRFGRRDLIPFFSRRIGIEQGEIVPILGGVRFSGRAGQYTLGILSMQTDEFEVTPSTNFSVLRLRRDILRNSDIGGLFVNKKVNGGDFNRTYGTDVNLKFLTYLNISSYILKTDTTGIDSQELAGAFNARWSDLFWDIEGEYLSIEDNFNPEVGFVPRPGIRKTLGELAVKPRPGESIGWIRQFRPGVTLDYITDQNNVLQTRVLDGSFTIELQNGGEIRFGHKSTFERLEEPFAIRLPQEIPVGDYQFADFSVSFFTDRSRAFSGDAGIETGEFFDGEKDSYRLGFLLQPSYHFLAEVGWEHDDVRLPSGDFTDNLVTSRFRYSFNTTTFLNALIQYNSTLKEVSSNIRFNWIYKPLSDLFLVYNERRASTGEVVERALIAKLTYVFDF